MRSNLRCPCGRIARRIVLLALVGLAPAACGDGEGLGGDATATSRPPSTARRVGQEQTGIGLPDVVEAIEELPRVDDVVRLPECRLEIEVVSDEIGFAYDSDVLDQRGLDTIRGLGEQLQQATSVEIVGHTSTDGATAYNQDLSQRRATAVEAALRAALPADRAVQISSRGAGETEPKVSPELGDEDRAKNRRVVLAVQFPQEACEG